MRQHLAERRPGYRRHQHIARRDSLELALAIDHARTSCSPADSRRMSVQSRMREPNLVGSLRLADVQRPWLKDLNDPFVHPSFEPDTSASPSLTHVHSQAAHT